MTGQYETPWTHSPPDWHENGVPYGDFCRCSLCGYVGRSTVTFDYYADSPGKPLRCEACLRGVPYSVEAAMSQAIFPN